ncbi:MAG: hypothetical protein HFH36_11830 [Lachnospiraceae bacterium]|nr:hypothetical protein [Lachnospiraceae bacterium]
MDNKIQDAFGKIKADAALKESTKDYLAKKRGAIINPIPSRAFFKAFAAACAMLLLTVGIGGFWWAQTPVSYVSIDINPSIELGLNRFERVVSATAYNPEGEEILRGLSLKGKRYTEAIDCVVESEAMGRYLAGKEELVLTVAAVDSQEKEIESGVAYYSGSVRHRCHSVSADIETAALAHDNGMSVGKYNAYLQLSQYDSEVTLDECRHMSMAQIHGLLIEHGHGGCREAQQEGIREGVDSYWGTDRQDAGESLESGGHEGHHHGSHHK